MHGSTKLLAELRKGMSKKLSNAVYADAIGRHDVFNADLFTTAFRTSNPTELPRKGGDWTARLPFHYAPSLPPFPARCIAAHQQLLPLPPAASAHLLRPCCRPPPPIEPSHASAVAAGRRAALIWARPPRS